jgi:hypothetical protein
MQTKSTMSVSDAGRKGGNARAKRLTKKRMSEIGKHAAAARWGKRKEKP